MKVAIAGYGVEGKANLKYWQQQGHDVVIVDERESIDDVPAGCQVISGKDAFERIDECTPDMVVRTAGLSPHKLHTKAKIWSATNEFFLKCPAPIIGVTGTKGKGTTCSFAASILKAAAKTVHLVGNIGIPALDVLTEIQPEDIVVYELSSFQLWDLERSPHRAAVLMIEPDHLDVHRDFAEYLEAKSHIVSYQNHDDVCFYHPKNAWSEAIAKNQPESATHVTKYNHASNSNELPEAAYVKGNRFITTHGRDICSTDEMRLPGVHNFDNACAAISLCLPYIDDLKTVAEGLGKFDGLDHRLKFVTTKNDVRYYDDSIATTPGSAIAATHAFTEHKVFIIGGSSKGADFSELAQELNNAAIRQVVLIGPEAQHIADTFKRAGFEKYIVSDKKTMAEIVEQSESFAQAGDVIILSPACASFDMFKDYKDRGDQFIAAARK